MDTQTDTRVCSCCNRAATSRVSRSRQFERHIEQDTVTLGLRGPDAERLVDRVITRSAAAVQPGRVIYTPWCDSEGKVIDGCITCPWQ